MPKWTRREFLRTAAAGIGTLTGAPFALASETGKTKRTATDIVTLGRSELKVTRLAFGTGSNGGSVQRALGQKEFTKIIRYAYDKGVRFFDTADNYGEMHEMLAAALEGLPRESYAIQTKMKWSPGHVPKEEIDRFRKELKTDYFDSFLLHCLQTSNWQEELKPLMDGLQEAKENKWIRSHGASCHGLKPLKAMAGCSWLDVALLRVNHDGTHMDGPTGEWAEKGSHDEAVGEIKKIHDSGTGVIGMKLIGNGDFTDPAQRDASLRFAMGLDCVDAIVIGFKSTAEIDEAIERMNKHLNA
ncbi:MAG: aldo/keto reductase [Candidatus Omnitrophota bacterium]